MSIRAFVGMGFGVGVVLALSGSAFAQDWSNSGGNAGRNGQTSEVGPVAPDVLWSGGATSLISWQPVIMGDRVFVVRQNGFPPEPNSDESPVICYDLDTGAELWRFNIPFLTGQWTTWIAGARDGRVYACRGGNGATSSGTVWALDATTGAKLWESEDSVDAGFYDGVVFADDGDLIVASFRDIWRINAEDGTRVWVASRQGSVSGSCGAAIGNDGVYVVDAVAGPGHAIKKFDLATGAFLYQSPTMTGFTVQQTPMVGPDGSVYLNRTQNNILTDFFYAFEDSGAAFTEKWSIPSQWTTNSEFTVGPDGSVYMLQPGLLLSRLDPSDGSVIDSGPVLDTDDMTNFSVNPRMASDANGNLFVSNGRFAAGRLYAFTASLQPLWDFGVTNVNIGGPAVGRDGTLVITGNGTQVIAFRSAGDPCDPDGCLADWDGTGGAPNSSDFLAYLNAWSMQDACADLAPAGGDGAWDSSDFLAFLNAYSMGC
ncbi:MAG: PQQ-binding-like beta-propeller repeat protein [Phycisphaerales bacterium]|jgi:outer membrane protein assembly factor BamB|nr:PQQ-binding-like beta-propeller repeat protein [Phycisphaerales bacterium]